MAAMSSLPSEAFLPSGAFDSETTLAYSCSNPWGSLSPIPSPSPSSCLPKSRSHYSRLHQGHLQFSPPKGSHDVPLSLASLRAANAAPSHHFSPHLLFESTNNPTSTQYLTPKPSSALRAHIPPRGSDRFLPSSSSSTASGLPAGPAASSAFSLPQFEAASVPRQASLSPDHPRPGDCCSHQRPSSTLSPSVPPAPIFRSASADAAAPATTSLHIVQRLAQQNALIQEAWEAERNHLEANRRRAEEVYQEERLIMEQVREGLENEKDDMQRIIDDLKERVLRLEGENKVLKDIVARSIQVRGALSPLASQWGGGTSTNNSLSPNYLSRVTSRTQNPVFTQSHSLASLPPGLEGAARRPHMGIPGNRQVPPTGHSRVAFHPRVPLSKHRLPVHPRAEPKQSISKDFLAPILEKSEVPGPIIDVREIDPTLDGIHIKANAVQKITFGWDGSSPRPCTTESNQFSTESPPKMDDEDYLTNDDKIRLTAAEYGRLKLHAGHTPSRSLSHAPPANDTDADDVVDHGGGHTPITASASEHAKTMNAGGTKEDNGKGVDRTNYAHSDGFSDEEHAEDPPLKAPLMVRNMPVHDEKFWKAVDQKLTTISQGRNALPTAAKDPGEQDTECVAGPSTERETLEARMARGPPTGGDGITEMEPLKFKGTSNFGAPFGAI